MSKKKKIKKLKKIDIYDVDHPFRRTAIDIINAVIEPLMQKGINGQQYYNLENSITLAIDQRLRKVIKEPLKADISPSLTNKILKNDHIDPEDNDDDDEECYCELNGDGDCCSDDCDCPCHN